MTNPTGKHRPKKRHPNEGTVVQRKGAWRSKPWAAVVPYLDATGRRREKWHSAESRAEAEEIRKREVAKLRAGRKPGGERTVGEYMTAWLATVEVGPGTWPRYEQHVTVRIIPSFGTVPLDQLTPQDVRTALVTWSGAPATRRGTLRLLRAGMKQAVADHLIEHDPTAGIPYPRLPKTQPRTLTGEQARDLMALVKGERFAPILVVTVGLGLRRGEALGLRTADIDLANRQITVSKQLRYIAPAFRGPGEGPYRLKATKTDQPRTIPLPAFVAEALRERLEERDEEQRAAKVYAPNDLVFCDERGNNVALETLYHWWKGLLKRAGLPDMRWHQLRASTVTMLYEADVPEAIIMAIVGHSDLETTRMYKGKTPRAMELGAKRLNEAMGFK